VARSPSGLSQAASSLSRAAPKEAKGRYRLRSQTNGSSLVDGRRFLAHHGVQVEKDQSFPAEAFGDGIVGFRFKESGTAATDEAPAPAKAETPAASQGASQTSTRKPARVGKRKVATATA
jgi:hypothetical protein